MLALHDDEVSAVEVSTKSKVALGVFVLLIAVIVLVGTSLACGFWRF